MAERKEYWTTEDGKKFDTKEEAIAHERELKSPEYELRKKIEELEQRVTHLEGENLKRVAEIEALKTPFQINKDPYQRPWWEKLSPTLQNVVGNKNSNASVFYGEGDSVEDALKNLKEVK